MEAVGNNCKQEEKDNKLSIPVVLYCTRRYRAVLSLSKLDVINGYEMFIMT